MFIEKDPSTHYYVESEQGVKNWLDIYPDMEDAKVVDHRGDYMCFSPAAPTHKAVMRRMPDYENAYIAARIPLGMMSSAGVGRIMSEYILEGAPPVHYKRALDFLSPERI